MKHCRQIARRADTGVIRAEEDALPPHMVNRQAKGAVAIRTVGGIFNAALLNLNPSQEFLNTSE